MDGWNLWQGLERCQDVSQPLDLWGGGYDARVTLLRDQAVFKMSASLLGLVKNIKIKVDNAQAEVGAASKSDVMPREVQGEVGLHFDGFLGNTCDITDVTSVT